MQRMELPNNTPEQIEEYMTAALELVERLPIPEDLREAAFTQACVMFSGKQLVLQQPTPLDLSQIVGNRRH